MTTHELGTPSGGGSGQAAAAQTVFEALGPEVFDRLVHNFYTRMRNDDLIGPMYPQHDWDGAESRLRMFLTQYWGGPSDYSAQRGHPRLRMRHMPFSIGEAEAHRWLEIMDAALTQFSNEEIPTAYREAIRGHMQSVAFMLINRAE